MKVRNMVLGIGALGLFAVGAVPALSDSDNAAVIIRDTGCVLYDGNGVLQSADGDVLLENNGGHTKFTCKASDLANDEGRAVRFDFESTGLPCSTAAGLTEDWFNQVSASGQSTLVCRVSD